MILLRYYDGLPPRTIARETGLPVGVVWRQLQRALALLRRRLDAAGNGDRSAWRLALVPLATAPRALPWRELIRPTQPEAWTGVLAMTTKTKTLCGAAALIVMTVLLGLWSSQGVPADSPPADGQTPPSAAPVRSPAVTSPVSAAPLPAMIRTDSEGRFRAIGLAVGEQPLQVRAAGFAPWHGTCHVSAGQTTALDVQLENGATIRGVVRAADGSPVPRATVSVGDDSDLLARSGTRSAADGRFVLTDLPAGEVEVRASDDRAGVASLTVHTMAGAAVACELRLSRGLEFRGRVLREDGTPVTGAWVSCSGLGGTRTATTDALGRFAIDNCPDGPIAVRVSGSGIEELRRPGIDPRDGEVELRVRPVATPSARLTGVVVDPDGWPVADLAVLAGREGHSVTRRIRATTAADGRFVFEPVVPGRWYLAVAAPGYPEFEDGPIEVGADSNRDLGTIRLDAGGTVRVRILDGDPSGVQFQLQRLDDGSRGPALQPGAGEFTSGAIKTGGYELVVFGNGTAEQTVPFEVRAGEETRIDLRLERGVRQRFEITIPAGAAAGEPIVLQARRGEDRVRRWSVRVPADPEVTSREAEVWLAPGSYTLAATCRSLRGTAPFRVGTDEGSPVQVDLR